MKKPLKTGHTDGAHLSLSTTSSMERKLSEQVSHMRLSQYSARSMKSSEGMRFLLLFQRQTTLTLLWIVFTELMSPM